MAEIVVTRIFDAPRERVWRAWTQPAEIARWWGKRGWTTPPDSVTMDVRPGGEFSLLSVSDEDGSEMRLDTTYREIVEPERLVFTHAWEDENGKPGLETLVTVTFAEQGGRTTMHFHQATFENKASRDGHADGWSSSFERLAEYLATL